MRTIYIILGTLLLAGFLQAQEGSYKPIKEEAERFYSEGSYGKANELYIKANALKLSAEDNRWIRFRLADTSWRADAGSNNSDPSKREKARADLDKLIRDIAPKDRNPLWAQVHESLGDYFMSRHQRNWQESLRFYQQALDYWASSTDLQAARRHYLRILGHVLEPSNPDRGYSYGYYGNVMPIEYAENALKIAITDEDKARAYYMLGMGLIRQGRQGAASARIQHAFENTLKFGKKNSWYDDALFQYAQWLSQTGPVRYDEKGTPYYKQDYKRALELFNRLITEFDKGESAHWDNAKNQIDQIIRPSLSVGVGQIYLPEAIIQYALNARNIAEAELTLHKIDLVEDVQFGKEVQAQQWLNGVQLKEANKVSSWKLTLNTNADHHPFSKQIDLDKKLVKGAYLLEAKGGGQSARELVLVSDISLLVKTSGRQALVYCSDASTGGPIANAKVKLWLGTHVENGVTWKAQTQTANAEGIAIFETPGNNQIFAAATSKDRQILSFAHTGQPIDTHRNWKIYAFTDRPAYRPTEKVQWKFYARVYNGSTYSTPAGKTITYDINDPRGTKVASDKIKLTQFGSGWGQLELKADMPLGEYTVQFFDESHNDHLGGATLFRMEEYKLPEFKVTVKTPEEKGKKKTFRLGERVEVEIQAEYYFGGAVANADVEVQVYQNPFHFYWRPLKDYDWLFQSEDTNPYRHYGRGQQIKSEKLKTGPDGRVILSFETPMQTGQDFEYKVEAKVTDSSRRVINNSSTVRVTRQRFFVHAEPQRWVYTPKTTATVKFQIADANHEPVQEKGRVTVFREFWKEIWLDPNLKEVQGADLARAKKQVGMFPPPISPGQSGWRLKFQGYDREEILSTNLVSGTEGKAELKFQVPSVGYYRAVWFSALTNEQPVRGETTVWVSSKDVREIGYRPDTIQIIAEQDHFKPGETAKLLLTAPEAERYVLLCVEGDELYSYKLHQLSGSSMLVDLPIEDKHVPNIFVTASMVSQRQQFFDQKELIVPPVKNLLTMELKSDRASYQPQEEGTLSLSVKDHLGKPVVGEFALSLTDESVLYIQSDYVGDPRQFFFGQKRYQRLQTQSSFNYKPYWLPEMELQFANQNGARFERSPLESASGEDKMAVAESMVDMAMPMPAMRKDGERENFSLIAGSARGAAKSPATRGKKEKGKQDRYEDEGPAVEVRSDFRSTILWMPDFVTGANGQGQVKITYPDSLTTWRAVARGASTGNQLGYTMASTTTRKPLITRLQAPRFFVVGDRVTISAVINNNTESPLTVDASLEATGVPAASLMKHKVTVPAGREKRVDWTIEPKTAGPIQLKTVARSGTTKDALSDAMEKSYFVHEHGIEKFLSKSGKTRSDSVTIRLDIPKERKEESTSLTVQITPSLAVTMLDALPYLIEYPYGCTEQTMSRFLPAVITSRTLKSLGLSEEDVATKMFGGIEPGRTPAANRGEKLQKLQEITKAGLARLYDFQHPDGGWGWWKEGNSDHYMSAYVLWGLTLAQEAGLEVKMEVVQKVVAFLQKELVKAEREPDQQTWMLHALALQARHQKRPVHAFETKAFSNIYGNRDQLNAYTRALLAIAAQALNKPSEARILIQNLENGVKQDARPDQSIVLGNTAAGSPEIMTTAHWGEDGVYWRWSEGGVEATAFVLRALLEVDPKNKLVEPTMNWLVKNRRGAQWSNTRDTAIVVLAMNDYLKASKELETEVEYEVRVNGQKIAEQKLSKAELLSAPSRIQVPAKLIKSGANEIKISRRKGQASLYFAAEAQFFSLEEPVTATGNEIFVRREFYVIRSMPTLLKGYQPVKEKLVEGQTIQSGDRIQAVLTIEAKNNYEYLVFEDLKAGGMEASELKSGGWLSAQELRSDALPATAASKDARIDKARRPATGGQPVPPNPNVEDRMYTGRVAGVYPEWRDRKAALFIDKLPQGVWQVKYEYRAEVPGEFHALPVIGHAMYVPEIRCNGAEMRIKISDAAVPLTAR